MRKSAREMLADWEIRPDFSDPERVRLVLSLIDDPDPDVVMEAVDAAVKAKLTGTEARLLGLLQSGRAKDPHMAALRLAEIVEGPEAIRVML